jgi:hypothetical protein
MKGSGDNIAGRTNEALLNEYNFIIKYCIFSFYKMVKMAGFGENQGYSAAR